MYYKDLVPHVRQDKQGTGSKRMRGHAVSAAWPFVLLVYIGFRAKAESGKGFFYLFLEILRRDGIEKLRHKRLHVLDPHLQVLSNRDGLGMQIGRIVALGFQKLFKWAGLLPFPKVERTPDNLGLGNAETVGLVLKPEALLIADVKGYPLHGMQDRHTCGSYQVESLQIIAYGPKKAPSSQRKTVL